MGAQVATRGRGADSLLMHNIEVIDTLLSGGSTIRPPHAEDSRRTTLTAQPHIILYPAVNLDPRIISNIFSLSTTPIAWNKYTNHATAAEFCDDYSI